MVTFATGISTTAVRFGYSNESRTYEIGAEGPLFELGGGDARLAVGAGYRTNGLLERNYLRGTINVEGDESSRFAYAELSLPLIGPGSNRSEEHTSELQSLMRISYAVFCLKKKIKKTNRITVINTAYK